MISKEKQDTIEIEQLAIDGGTPARTKPLPLEFPGMHFFDDEEVEAAVRVLKSRSPFRYYGIDLQSEVDAFEGNSPNSSASTTRWQSRAAVERCRPRFPR